MYTKKLFVVFYEQCQCSEQVDLNLKNQNLIRSKTESIFFYFDLILSYPIFVWSDLIWKNQIKLLNDLILSDLFETSKNCFKLTVVSQINQIRYDQIRSDKFRSSWKRSDQINKRSDNLKFRSIQIKSEEHKIGSDQPKIGSNPKKYQIDLICSKA